ncbi:Ger(x)C family spore germination protein [Bacillus sp. J33]|uniref:Ger(x)C family spore germination protein n=1 Tax=Bacillus sp. J33 TaxID=935836 RepID=UPI0004796556|nr:Ger(x)C family spore germination protein [Bacillus sp. J33]
MRNRFFIWMRTFILFLAILSLTGCWSAKNVNDLAIINIIGIDQTDNGEIEVSTLLAKPDALFTQANSGGQGNETNKFLIQTATGKSIFEAMGKLSKSISERIYLGHANVVIFGEKAAREKMESSLDFFRRDNESRPGLLLLVTKGLASEIIKTSPELNSTLGLEINDMVTSDQFSATKMVNDLSQFLKDLSSNTTDPITGVIVPANNMGIEAEGEKRESQDDKQDTDNMSVNGNETPKALSLQGTAVFRGGNLKGFLDERETRGLLSIQGKLQNEIIMLNCGGHDNGTVGLMIKDTRSQFNPRISGQNLKMDVNIQVEADIGEITCSNLQLDTDEIEQLNKQLEDLIKQDSLSVLGKAQKQWETDIFGFGESIYRNSPKEWDQLAPEWRSGNLKKMNVNLHVESNISRYGLQKEKSEANDSR